MQNNLRALRIAKGMTQIQVAKLLGFSTQNRVSRWESGKASARVANLFGLARLFSVKVERLYSKK